MDELRIEIMNPWEEHEDWARDFYDENTYAPRLLVNGRELMDIMNDIEMEKTGKRAGYGHNHSIFSMYDNLDDMFMPFCCPQCGEDGCCDFSGSIRITGKTVYWEKFHSWLLHDYGVEFCFERKKYLETIKAWHKLEDEYRIASGKKPIHNVIKRRTSK